MDRIVALLKMVNGLNEPIKIDVLAKQLNVSDRTIRNDLEFIEETLKTIGVDLIRHRSLGVKLSQVISEKDLTSFIKHLNNTKDFLTFEERNDLIIETTLSNNDYVTLNELEELLMSSRTSLQKNLISCEEFFNSYHLKLVKKKHKGIVLEGSEFNKRLAIVNHITNKIKRKDFEQSYTSLMTMKDDFNIDFVSKFSKKYLKIENRIFVINFIKRYENANNIQFTDEAFLAIFILISISINRIKDGYEYTESNYVIRKFFENKYIEKLMNNELSFINSGLEAKFNTYEKETILLFMLSQKRKGDFYNNKNDFLLQDHNFLTKSLNIVENFIKAIDEFLNTNLSQDQKLVENLLLHIRPTIFRLLFGIKLDNPLKEEIKNSYSHVFAACKYASKEITIETNSNIDDNEICYLALHVEASLEKNKKVKQSQFIKTVIVCPDGVGTSNILYYRLLNTIPDIVIDKICSIMEFNKIDKENIDLVISTVPMYGQKNMNIITVNPLLFEDDIIKIKQSLKKITVLKETNPDSIVNDICSIVSKQAIVEDYSKLQKEISKYFDNLYNKTILVQQPLNEYIKDELILLNQEANTWQEAFGIAGELLSSNGYILKTYIDSSIANVEKYGLYISLGNGTVLMHTSSDDGVIKTGFSFVTLKKPVEFIDENEVKKIDFVICMAADKSMNHYTAMTQLIDIVSNSELLNKVKKTIKISDFKSIFQNNE